MHDKLCRLIMHRHPLPPPEILPAARPRRALRLPQASVTVMTVITTVMEGGAGCGAGYAGVTGREE
jgi:hypothetical protein